MTMFLPACHLGKISTALLNQESFNVAVSIILVSYHYLQCNSEQAFVTNNGLILDFPDFKLHIVLSSCYSQWADNASRLWWSPAPLSSPTMWSLPLTIGSVAESDHFDLRYQPSQTFEPQPSQVCVVTCRQYLNVDSSQSSPPLLNHHRKTVQTPVCDCHSLYCPMSDQENVI